MTNRIMIIAHAPLAKALKDCALHVYPDCGQFVTAIDIHAQTSPEESLSTARVALDQLSGEGVLVLTDIFGATPSNVAQQLITGSSAKLVAGVNLPMLLRTVCYCHETLDMLVSRALAGGSQGVMQVATSAPQNQIKKHHDSSSHHHQQ